MNFDPRARLVDWSVVIGELAAFQDVLQGAPAPSRPMNLDETLRLARRVRRLPELQSAAQERQDEAKASQWINGHLIQSLFPLAARIQNELAELTGASDAAITFQISTGGAELRRLVEVEPRFAFPEYIPSMVSPNQTSGAPVLYTIQSIAEPEIPTLYLGLYVVRIRRQFWILRVPILAYPPRVPAKCRDGRCGWSDRMNVRQARDSETMRFSSPHDPTDTRACRPIIPHPRRRHRPRPCPPARRGRLPWPARTAGDDPRPP
jgi:hypothetical protein